jgi:transposase
MQSQNLSRNTFDLGAPKAITATAHKIARLFYKYWSTGRTYSAPREDYYEQKYRERLVKHLKKTVQSPGFEVVPQSPMVESVS